MKYNGMWDVLTQAVEREGVRGLYKVQIASPKRPVFVAAC